MRPTTLQKAGFTLRTRSLTPWMWLIAIPTVTCNLFRTWPVLPAHWPSRSFHRHAAGLRAHWSGGKTCFAISGGSPVTPFTKGFWTRQYLNGDRSMRSYNITPSNGFLFAWDNHLIARILPRSSRRWSIWEWLTAGWKIFMILGSWQVRWNLILTN